MSRMHVPTSLELLFLTPQRISDEVLSNKAAQCYLCDSKCRSSINRSNPLGKIVSNVMYLGKCGVGEVIIECGGKELCSLL